MSRTINYTTRTFYVPASKMHTLVQFQNKCKENAHKSYSEVLVKLMQTIHRKMIHYPHPHNEQVDNERFYTENIKHWQPTKLTDYFKKDCEA